MKLSIEFMVSCFGEVYFPLTPGQIATISEAPDVESRKALLKKLVMDVIWDEYDRGDKEIERWDYTVQSDNGSEDYILDDWGVG